MYVYDEDTHPQQIKDLMAKGYTVDQVAAAFGVVRETIYRWKDRYPVFKQAFYEARTLSKAWYDDQLQNAAFSPGKDNNAALIIFMGKARFHELRNLDNSFTLEGGDPEKPVVNVNLSQTEWLKKVKGLKQQQDVDDGESDTVQEV